MTKTDILLMLLFADNKAPIVGTTRLQKLLFLTEHENKIICEDESFDFEAYKFGPVSKTLYDDIDFLVNIGFLEKTGEDSSISTYSLDELDNIDAKNLIEKSDEDDDLESEEDDEAKQKEATDAEKVENEKATEDDLVVYKITDKGIVYLRENNLIGSKEATEIDSIKKRYGKKPLIELLRYVYMKYPEYTTDSDIKDQLL